MSTYRQLGKLLVCRQQEVIQHSSDKSSVERASDEYGQPKKQELLLDNALEIMNSHGHGLDPNTIV